MTANGVTHVTWSTVIFKRHGGAPCDRPHLSSPLPLSFAVEPLAITFKINSSTLGPGLLSIKRCTTSTESNPFLELKWIDQRNNLMVQSSQQFVDCWRYGFDKEGEFCGQLSQSHTYDNTPMSVTLYSNAQAKIDHFTTMLFHSRPSNDVILKWSATIQNKMSHLTL